MTVHDQASPVEIAADAEGGAQLRFVGDPCRTSEPVRRARQIVGRDGTSPCLRSTSGARYITLESITLISDDPLVSLPAVAA